MALPTTQGFMSGKVRKPVGGFLNIKTFGESPTTDDLKFQMTLADFYQTLFSSRVEVHFAMALFKLRFEICSFKSNFKYS